MHLIDHLVRHRVGRNIARALVRVSHATIDVIDDALSREVIDLTVAHAIVPDYLPEDWS